MDLFGEPDPPGKEEEIVEQDLTQEQPTIPQEGLLHPRLMDFCLGHHAHETKLQELFDAGRMPHGIVLAGPRGIGKTTFAYRLARFLLKQPATTDFNIGTNDPVFKKVASGGHPDLICIERAYDAAKDEYKDNVAVDEVRKVAPFLHKTASYDGGWRVVLIDDADTMNRNAQNALLKILEEPPAKTVLILVAHRLGALFPTIRSRTQTMSFHTLSKPDFQTLLKKQGYVLEPDQLDTIFHMAGGSIGLALEIIEQGGLDTLEEILTMFKSWPEWSWIDIHALSEQLARSGRDNNYQNFTMLLPWIFAQMIAAKARGHEIASKALHLPAIETLHKQSSLETLLKICENLTNHFERVDRANLDKRQAVLGAFSIITA